MANINKIRLSGQTYNIEDVNASKTVELTQAQYDALSVKDPNTFYVITDAQGADLSNYYTKSETSGATEISTALNAKADTATTYNKTEVDTALAGKQDTLVAGDNITISGNVISAEGGGSITIDPSLDSGSTNPVANSAITTAIDAKVTKISRETADWAGSGVTILNVSYNGTNSKAITFCASINNKQILTGSNYSKANKFNLVETSAITTSITSSSTDAQVPSAKAVYDALQEGGGGSSYTAGDGIDITNDVISVTGKVDTTAFTAHTADTVIHVTSAEKTAWNAKSDFSGDYNDLTNKPTIPTVPTSNTAFTNDAGYITSDAISGKADTSAVTESINAAVSGKVDTTTYNTYTAATDTAIAGKQDTLVSGTNIKTINNESILGSGNITIEGGGGKAINAGTNISVTTGETADTINCTLSGGTLINISNNKINCSAPIRYGTGINGVIVGSSVSTNKASGMDSIANGGNGNTASGQYSYAEGFNTQATKHSSHSEGWFTIASGNYSHTEGNHTNTTNESEHASGQYNVSNITSSTFGNSGNTLFSVGNGASASARHNAFEIRQNGDIYYFDGTNDVKLQDKFSSLDTTIGNINTILESI